MERSDWRKSSEKDDDEPRTPGQSSARSARPAPPAPPRETAPRLERHTIPAASALEGVISWRQQEDLWRKPETSDTKETDDDDDDEAENRPTSKAVGIASVSTVKKSEQTREADDSDEDTAAAGTTAVPPPSVAPSAESDDGLFVYPEDTPVVSAERDTDEEPGDDPSTPVRSAPPARPTAPLTRPPGADASAEPRPTYPTPAPAYRPATPIPAAETPVPSAMPFERAADHEPETAAPDRLTDADEHSETPLVSPAEASTVRPTRPYHEASDDYSVTAPLEIAPDEPPHPPVTPLPPVGGGVPPGHPNFGFDPNLYPMPGGNEYPFQTAPAAAAPERPAPSSAMPDGAHRHGEPLAVVANLGVLAEHIGRKRVDRKQQKQIDRLAEQAIEQQQDAAARHLRMQEQQRGFAAEQQRQTAELQRMRSEQERSATVPLAQYNLEHTAASQHQPQRFEAAPNVPVLRPGSAYERPPQGRDREQMSSVAVLDAEQQQPDQMGFEVPALRPEQHVEHSAWHNIVVDKHGHEVSGAMEYGQEFHRQREHEMLRDRMADAQAAGTTTGAAGPASQQAGQGGPFPGYQQDYSGLPSGMTSPVLPPGPSTHADPQHQLPAAPRKQVTSNIANPWFWLMLGLIVAVFFTAALV